MQTKTNVVPDSNVFIAAALSRSYCHDWIFGASEPQATYKLHTSEDILKEVERKLLNKFNFERADTSKFLSDLDQVLNKVRPGLALQVVRDPKDNMVLECAIEAKAELVITFDKDLLTLKRYEGVQFAHPSMIKYWFPKQGR